jgi:hypothetical protein
MPVFNGVPQMSAFAAKYKIPPEIDQFIDNGFLKLLSENEGEKTITFDVPAISWKDDNNRDTTFTLIWIHPDFNDQFCHYYNDKPGDLANFYVMKGTTDTGDDWLDLTTPDDLLVWLDEQQAN